MKKYEITAMDEVELRRRIMVTKKELERLKFTKVVEPPQSPMIFRGLRKDIARMMTRLNKIQKEKNKG